MGSRQAEVTSSQTGSDIMATGSDVIKPEVKGNQRQTTRFGKKDFFIQRSGLVPGLSGGVGGMSVM